MEFLPQMNIHFIMTQYFELFINSKKVFVNLQIEQINVISMIDMSLTYFGKTIYCRMYCKIKYSVFLVRIHWVHHHTHCPKALSGGVSHSTIRYQQIHKRE